MFDSGQNFWTGFSNNYGMVSPDYSFRVVYRAYKNFCAVNCCKAVQGMLSKIVVAIFSKEGRVSWQYEESHSDVC